MKKLATLFAALAVMAIASPSFAQFATERDASVGYCEGCQSGNLSLILTGTGGASVFGLLPDADTGKWSGFGSVSYHANGINIEESAAHFLVTFAPAPDGGCPPVSQFPSIIEAFDPNGVRVLFASGLHYEAGYDVAAGLCPWGRLTANVGRVPDSLVRLKLKYLR